MAIIYFPELRKSYSEKELQGDFAQTGDLLSSHVNEKVKGAGGSRGILGANRRAGQMEVFSQNHHVPKARTT